MFPREVRLTFQDFYAYRAAGITYDRGLILDRSAGPVEIAIGAVNGNGIMQNLELYLFAVLKNCSLRVNFSKSRLGFCIPALNLNIEATIRLFG